MSLEERYKQTGDLLRRSICLNVPVIFKDEKIKKLINTIKAAVVKVYGKL